MVADNKKPKTIYLLMSSGNFDGIDLQLLAEDLI